MRNVILPWAMVRSTSATTCSRSDRATARRLDVLSEKVGHITSVEIDEQLASMLDRALRFRPTNVEIVHGDGTALAYPDDRFSGAACFTMLHHVPDHRAAGSPLRGGGQRARAGRRARCRATASAATSSRPITRTTRTTRSIPSRSTARLRAAGLRRRRGADEQFGWAAIARRAGLGQRSCEARISASLISHLCSHSRPCWYMTPLRRSMCSRKPGPPHSGQRVGFPQIIFGAGGEGPPRPAQPVLPPPCPC